MRAVLRKKEDEGYLSRSTIDHPPCDVDDEEGQDRQINLLDEPDAMKLVEDGEPHERNFNVQLQLTLTPDDGKPTRMCLVAGMCRGTVVQELLERAINSRRNKKRIAAELDNPKDRVEEN